MTVSEWKVYPCVTCALRLHERCGVGCSRWNDSKTERSPGFFWQAGGARQTVSLYVSTHTAEPTARPSSKMWQYLATEQHCCTSLKSNFKGYNSPGQFASDDNYAVSWSSEYTPDFLFILQIFIVTGEGEGEERERQGQSDGGTERVREVMREMEFAGCVWDRFASWSCKCLFCLHVCACRRVWLCFSSLPGGFFHIIALRLA